MERVEWMDRRDGGQIEGEGKRKGIDEEKPGLVVFRVKYDLSPLQIMIKIDLFTFSPYLLIFSPFFFIGIQ